jgi:TM2 domain-containing membrane protein YozV
MLNQAEVTSEIKSTSKNKERILQGLEKISREVYAEFSHGTNQTFDKIEEKYIKKLIIDYWYSIESAKKLVQEFEIQTFDSITEAIESSLPFVPNQNYSKYLEKYPKIIEKFLETWDMSKSFLAHELSLPALENEWIIEMAKRTSWNELINKKSEKSVPKIYQKNIAGLLGVFLGWLGVHKFYLDRPIQGIVYIIFCFTFIPAIIWFLEWISYFSYKNDDEFTKKMLKP